MSASEFAKMKDLERRITAIEVTMAELKSLMELLRQGADNKAVQSKPLSLKKAS